MVMEVEIDTILEPELNKELKDPKHRKIPRKKREGTPTIVVTKAKKENIESENPDVHDSPLTFHGTVRKKTYPKNRKSRAGKGYTTKKMKMDLVKNNKIKLLSFAPEFANIYTVSYVPTDRRRYIYMDVFAIVDNRLYKINKLLANVLGYRVSKNLGYMYGIASCLMVPFLVNPENVDKSFVQIEEKLIKELSSMMFGYADGYFWQSLYKLHAFDAEHVAPKKDFNVSQVKEDAPKKNYRLR